MISFTFIPSISLSISTAFLSSNAALTSFASFLDEIIKLCFFANTSTANAPLISVAVVIIGVAPSAPPIYSANSLAPPTCPESRDITYLPSSSITSTAGSLNLSFTYGAILLIAIPVAPTKIIASSLKCSFTVSFKSLKAFILLSVRYFCIVYEEILFFFNISINLIFISLPFFVNEKTVIFISFIIRMYMFRFRYLCFQVSLSRK